MEEILLEKINNLASVFCEEMGVELVDLKVRRFQGNTSIEILADKKFGGITIAQCSALNRKVSAALEAENTIGGSYTVEVSSPGLDRPLCSKKDFMRARNRDVRFFLTQPLEEKLEYAGTIEEVEEENVVVNVGETMIHIPINIINKAKYII